jgi:hypothetical protein
LEEYGEHEDHIRILLERLREHQLYAKLRMCEFCIKEVPFLGHVVAPEGIVVDPSMVKGGSDWRPPTTGSRYGIFLGWLAIIEGSF